MIRKERKGDDLKLALLEEVRKRKDILFSKFDNEVENNTKIRAWEEVLEKAKSLNIVSADRDYRFVRDKVFSVWKSRTMEKKDNAKKTGTGGGKKAILSALDHAILDIVGKDSPVVEGLAVGEVGTGTDNNLNPESELELHTAQSSISLMFPALPGPSGATTVEKTSAPPHSKKRKISAEEKDEVLIAKWKAQTELLVQQAYNVKLQNWRLERELGIERSTLTKDLMEDFDF